MTEPMKTGTTDWREEVRKVAADIRAALVTGDDRSETASNIAILTAAIDDLYSKFADLSYRTPV
jgi:hypothetical protein